MEIKADTGTGGQAPPRLLFITVFILQLCFTNCSGKTSPDFVTLQGYLTFSYHLSLAIKISWLCKSPEVIDNPWIQIALDLQSVSIKSIMAFSASLENGGNLGRSTLQPEKGRLWDP